LSEYGGEGESREREAKELAETADLILFVLDHDLIRAELDALLALTALRKRLIVVFNKKDRFTDEDRAAVLAKLRERLQGKVAAPHIVSVAAAPRPVPVRVMQARHHRDPLRARGAGCRRARSPDRRDPGAGRPRTEGREPAPADPPPRAQGSR